MTFNTSLQQDEELVDNAAEVMGSKFQLIGFLAVILRLLLFVLILGSLASSLLLIFLLKKLRHLQKPSNVYILHISLGFIGFSASYFFYLFFMESGMYGVHVRHLMSVAYDLHDSFLFFEVVICATLVFDWFFRNHVPSAAEWLSKYRNCLILVVYILSISAFVTLLMPSYYWPFVIFNLFFLVLIIFVLILCSYHHINRNVGISTYEPAVAFYFVIGCSLELLLTIFIFTFVGTNFDEIYQFPISAMPISFMFFMWKWDKDFKDVFTKLYKHSQQSYTNFNNSAEGLNNIENSPETEIVETVTVP